MPAYKCYVITIKGYQTQSSKATLQSMISPRFHSRRAVTTLFLLASSASYANASEQVELAPSTINATAQSQDGEHLDSVTHAGSRLSLTALQTPASTSSLNGDEVRSRGDENVQQAVARSPGITAIGTPGDRYTRRRRHGVVRAWFHRSGLGDAIV
ncbi:Plug domain-containing protein [Pseudomonas sp. ST1]|nr:Plug domain-containing protein [Pseudomonas sp. ST1]